MKGSKKTVSAEVLLRTQQIATLCLAMNLVPTDTYAVKKEIQETKYSTTEVSYTRWGTNENGKRGLIVLKNEKRVRFYTPDEIYKCRTVKD